MPRTYSLNAITKTSYALVWNLQTVARERVQAATAAVTPGDGVALKRAIAEFFAR